MIKNILQYIERNAERAPSKVAFADVKNSYTNAQLVNTAKRIGSYISSKGYYGEPIFVYMDKTAHELTAFMAVVYAGCYYIPIDHQMPIDRIRLIADTAKPVLVIYDKVTAKKIDTLDIECEMVNFEDIANTEINESSLSLIRGDAIDTDLIYILFTSGSTGMPKGVAVCHRSVIDYAEWLCETFDFDETTIFGNQTPFYFSMSVLDIYATISSNATLWIIPKMNFSFPVRLLEFLNEHEINTLYWVPSALSIVANIGALDEINVPSLKKILFAGESMPTKQFNMWKRHYPDVLFANLFGPTEITDIGVYYIVDREFKDDESIPIGYPCDNVGVLVIDEEGNQVKQSQIGKLGELLIRGSYLAMGYYNDLEKTNSVFVQNPLQNSYPELVYKTGDLVFYNEYGELVYKSRKDFQIKHLGHRIELGEIENVLSSHENVNMCCCLYNNSKQQIVACYTGDVSGEELGTFLKNKVPHYMLPGVYEQLKVMPLNANGKIDRGKLSGEYGN